MKTTLNSAVNIENNNSINKYKSKLIGGVDREYVYKLLKNGIWVYFVLLIFEGAIRKWILPGLATPLLIIRDPIAIWLLYTAWKYNEFPVNNYVWAVYLITIIAVFTAITVGHGNIAVALYGARIFLFHFPLIFLIGRIFNREDVIKMLTVTLIIAVPMFVIIALQFYSPQGSFINRGIGGDTTGAGFSGALGYFRPSGTFSFTSGNTQFFGFVGIIIIYFWLNPTQINRLLLIAGTFSLMGAIPLSISRTLFFQIGVSIIFAGISVVSKPKYTGRVLIALTGIIVILAILSQAEFFSKAVGALSSRFDAAKSIEGGTESTLSNRLGDGFFEPFQQENFPVFGFGIGMGTNVGAQLLVGNSSVFLISEGEWGRLIGEMGAVLGIAMIAIRIRLCLKLVAECYKRLQISDLLPWMILSISLQELAQGQWAQPTALGFSVMMAGLTIASLNVSEN